MHKIPYNRAELEFELRAEIGADGKNSRTHVAYDPQLNAEIVIKQIAKSTLESVDTYFDESRHLYLSSHSNVVQIHYACLDKDCIYIAMPYYRRGSLKQLIDRRFLTVREIVVFGCQIISGLHNIHSKGLVHFDIKPDNVLLSERGEALVSDFGLARKLSQAGIAEQDRFYAKNLPPESFGKYEHTRSFDVYQLGLTIYRMCNGDKMFYQQFEKYGDQANFKRDEFRFDVRNGRFPDRSAFKEHIPQRLRTVVTKCLEPDPNERYGSVIEIANDLAMINEKFDWEYTPDGDGHTWTLESDGRQIKLIVDADMNSSALKTINGCTTKITGYCQKNISVRDIKKFLKETS
ncbi:serine/threonine-protein kinase [Herbaspirillum sp. RTI4]|uniref:serine/threonine-protein kinase n=1 Tax=Herbaspirillum sp. RTI4 TaxID=3048640 RepID=UPI002AB55734|nr:serine/threonine-protein kinase [Herbaspirillum sp. RTI4]MDY7579293.1 serine/threonine-protein kinase [Herbaspirillum sp. RTI4]MEA9982792.1 serine/threonine-protein kinase [Herbaspirillum sp. RTI4]